MENEIIKLKGTGDGVRMYLSDTAPFSEVLSALHDKLWAWLKFFGTGHCKMYFLGRKLTKSDMLRIEAVVKALLPECTILYEESGDMGKTVQLPKSFVESLKKNEIPEDTLVFGSVTETAENASKDTAKISEPEKIEESVKDTEKSRDEKSDANLDDAEEAAFKKKYEGEYVEKRADAAAEKADDGGISETAEKFRDIITLKDVITNNYKSNRARLYEGVVRSGRAVQSDGHLILVGNVEAGGTLIAVGNVIVLGSILGSVQAGCMGNKSAYVIALDMQPTDLRIAHANKRYSLGEITKKNVPQIAILTKNEIHIQDFLSEI